VKYTI